MWVITKDNVIVNLDHCVAINIEPPPIDYKDYKGYEPSYDIVTTVAGADGGWFRLARTNSYEDAERILQNLAAKLNAYAP